MSLGRKGVCLISLCYGMFSYIYYGLMSLRSNVFPCGLLVLIVFNKILFYKELSSRTSSKSSIILASSGQIVVLKVL